MCIDICVHTVSALGIWGYCGCGFSPGDFKILLAFHSCYSFLIFLVINVDRVNCTAKKVELIKAIVNACCCPV